MRNDNDRESQRQLEVLTRLLMVLLLKLGATAEEIGYALEVHPSRISQLLPVRKIKPVLSAQKPGA